MAGNIAGTVGVAVCLVTGGARLAGISILLGFESMTIFIAGIALITTACLLKLHAMQLP